MFNYLHPLIDVIGVVGYILYRIFFLVTDVAWEHKAIKILRVFEEAGSGMPMYELAEKLGCNKLNSRIIVFMVKTMNDANYFLVSSDFDRDALAVDSTYYISLSYRAFQKLGAVSPA